MKTLGNIFVVIGPSGSGKTAIVNRAIELDPMIKRNVTCTTRSPRDGEVNGIDYHFLKPAEFKELDAWKQFAETSTIYGNSYGTRQSDIIATVNSGFDCVLILDQCGADAITSLWKECLTISILPPSEKVLIQRLTARKPGSDDDIQARLHNAKEEIGDGMSNDYLIVNDDLNQAVSDFRAIIKTKRLAMSRQIYRQYEILQQFGI